MSRSEAPSAPREAKTMVRNYADLLDYVPDPPETFVIENLDGQHVGTVDSLRRVGVVERVGYKAYEGRDREKNDRLEYRLAQWVPEVVENVLENRDGFCPCGHSGLSNCGDHFECGFELCEREFEREDLEVDT